MLKAPFRANNGQYYTKSLFYEPNVSSSIENRNCEPAFTLYADKPGLVNFGTEYVADMDMSGYKTAKRLLKDWAHWQMLMQAQWFREAKAIWDVEIEAKIESDALATIVRVANDPGDKNALQAAKFLAAKMYKAKTSNRGRPTNDEVAAKLKQATDDRNTLKEDLKRINNVVPIQKAQ